MTVFATNCKELERCPLNLENKYTFALDEDSESQQSTEEKRKLKCCLYFTMYEVNMGLETLCQIHFKI